MEEQKSRIDELISSLGLTQSMFATRVGVSANAITNWKARGIKGSAYEKIAKAFPEVNIAWLQEGSGEMFTGVAGKKLPHFPVVARAGSLSSYSASVKEEECEMRPIIAGIPSYDFTMSLKGDSMEPKYESGDIIAIRKVYDYIEWGKVYVLDTADGAIVKRLYDAGDKYKCVSYNPEYPEFFVEKSSVFGVFKVVGMLRI